MGNKMKYISIAIMALMSQASGYATSEGPTKADYGEHDDEATVIRADRFKNGWSNPLSWTDDGEDDHVVLTMLDGTLRMSSEKHRRPQEATTVLTMLDGTMRPIYDADGDGVEDNVKKTHDELDRFYEPAVYGVAEDIYNTHHGNLPGHVRKAEYQGAPEHHAGDVKSNPAK